MNKNKIKQFFLLFLFCIFLSSLITNYDYDLFARLEVGEIFFKLHTVLKHDPFSYTPTHYWYDHEWGSGVIFYAFLKLLGCAGLIMLNAGVLALTALFVVSCRDSECKSENLIFPITVSTIMLAFMHYAGASIIRCQTFTFCFTALFILILEKFERENSNLIWFLPVITAFWCNMHGGVASGLGIITIYLISHIIQRKNIVKLSASALLSYLALLINPYGIKYFAYMLYTITVPRTYIYEWLDIFQPIHFMHYLPVLILIICILVIKIFNDGKNKSYNLTHYMVIFFTVYFGLRHIKTIELALIVLFAYTYPEIVKLLSKFKVSRIVEKSIIYAILASILAIPFTIGTPRLTFGAFPLTEVEFLKINDIKGNIIVPFEMGSYISYKLYPDNLIFMDGRYDGVYSFKIFNDLSDFCNKREGWLKAIENYPTEIIMIETYDPAYYALKNNKTLGWEEIYRGYLCGLFVKKENLKTSYFEPNYDINYYRENVFRTNFIKTVKGKYD